MIVNTPWAFTAAWTAMKPFMGEEQKARMKVIKGNPYNEIKKLVDDDNIPKELGGSSTKPLDCDHGPWNQFELVDGTNPDDVVGIRKKDDPRGRVFTVLDFEGLPNEHL